MPQRMYILLKNSRLTAYRMGIRVRSTAYGSIAPIASMTAVTRNGLTAAVYALAVARAALCMMPQNQWLSADAPLVWGIYRNIPFALLGLLIIVLFSKSAKEHGDRAFRWMWLTIVLSFGFYIPVVLWADAVPLIGMLMIPKTCAYVWTVWIGYSDMRKTSRA